MKVKILIVGVLSILGSLIIVGFANKNSSNDNNPIEVKGVKKTTNKLSCFSSDRFNKFSEVIPNYLVRGASNRTITKYKLSKAKTLKDIVEDYPSNWIENYITVETYRITKDEAIKEVGDDINLNSKQQELFNNIHIGDDILIRVVYKDKESLGTNNTKKETNITMTVVPEVSASFREGNEQLVEYLKKNSTVEILNWNFNPMQNATALFTVNEMGEVGNVKVTKTTGIISVDKAIIKMLYKMPKWNPARNSKGELVSQQFELIIGEVGC
ncbi:energy transducer TonB [Tenacibaculum aiptasiae]|uniref:energy transducer TonB n=1 Tax=Tenacibaculum aiptasiae TaxID=426481 RepID=UPI003B5BF9CB